MTATTVKGTEITNIEASPITVLDRKVSSGEPRFYKGHASVATTSIDETADVVLFVAVPSNIVVDGVYIKNDDLDTNGCPTLAVDVGVYYSGIGTIQELEGRASGDEIDVDLFGSAVTTLQAANVTWAEVTNEAQDIANYGTELWSAAGLSSDPGGKLYIGFKVTTVAATAAAGDVVIKVVGSM